MNVSKDIRGWSVGEDDDRQHRVSPFHRPPRPPDPSYQIGVYPGVLQLVAMFVAMILGFALSVGPAFPVFEKHTGLQLFMVGAVTTHLTVR